MGNGYWVLGIGYWVLGTRDPGPGARDWDWESGPSFTPEVPGTRYLVVVHRRLVFRQTGVHHGGVHELGDRSGPRGPAGIDYMPVRILRTQL
jgi:hypothetical protein